MHITIYIYIDFARWFLFFHISLHWSSFLVALDINQLSNYKPSSYSQPSLEAQTYVYTYYTHLIKQETNIYMCAYVCVCEGA